MRQSVNSVWLRVDHVTAFVLCAFFFSFFLCQWIAFLNPVALEWPDLTRVAPVVSEQDHPQSNTEWVIAVACVTRPSLTRSGAWLTFAPFTKPSDIITHAARAEHRPTPSDISPTARFTLDYFYGFRIAKQKANVMHILMKWCTLSFQAHSGIDRLIVTQGCSNFGDACRLSKSVNTKQSLCIKGLLQCFSA